MRRKDHYRRVRRAMRELEAHVSAGKSDRARASLRQQAVRWVDQARRAVGLSLNVRGVLTSCSTRRLATAQLQLVGA